MDEALSLTISPSYFASVGKRHEITEKYLADQWCRKCHGMPGDIILSSADRPQLMIFFDKTPSLDALVAFKELYVVNQQVIFMMPGITVYQFVNNKWIPLHNPSVPKINKKERFSLADVIRAIFKAFRP